MIKIILLSLLLINFSNAKELEKISLQLQWLHQFQFAGYYIAKEKGFYKDVGLDVEIREYKNTLNIVNEVIKGSATYATGRPTLIIDKSNGADIVLLASIFQSSPHILLTTKHSGIKSIKDFKNRRLMSTGDAKSDVALISMIYSQKVELEDLIIQKTSFNVQDLIDKKTDLMASYISNEPFKLKELGVEPIVFDPKDYGFDFYSDILFTSGNEHSNHHDRMHNFKDASIKGWKYAFNNIEESVELILSKYNSQNKSREALIYEAKKLKELAYYKTKNLGDINLQKIEKIYDIYHLMGFIKNKFNFNEFIIHEYKEIKLTLKERAYLKAHPIIKAHNEKNWPPFNYNKKGKAVGFSIDYMNLLASKLDIEVEYINGYSWSKFMQMLQTPTLDVMINIVKNEQRAKSISFTDIFYSSETVIYVNKKNQNFYSLKDLKNRKVASVKDFSSHKFLEKNYPKIKQILVKNKLEALKLLSLKKVDAVIGIRSVMDYIIEDNSITNIITTEYIKDKSLVNHLRLGTSKEDKILRDILNKAQNLITEKEMIGLKKKWFGVEKYSKNRLNDEELAYLKNKKVIKMCVMPSSYPLEGILNGKHIGISSDIFNIIKKQLPIPIEIVKSKTNRDSYLSVTKAKCDIKSIMLKDFFPFKNILSTQPYIEDDFVVITKVNKPFIQNQKQYRDKKFVVKYQGHKNYLTENFPFLNLIVVKNSKEALKLLESEKVYGYITISVMANNIIQNYGFRELKVNTKIKNATIKIAVGILKSEPELLMIVNKLLKTISKEEVENIKARWSMQRYKKIIDYSVIWKMFFGFILILLIILFFYNRERKLKNRLEETQKNLDLGQDIANIGIWNLNHKTDILTWTKGVHTIFGTNPEIFKVSFESFIELIHPKDRDRVRKQYYNSIKEKKDYFIQHKIVLSDGSTKCVEERCQNFFDRDGNIIKSTGTVLDITQRKKVEFKLAELTKSLSKRVKEEVEYSRQKDQQLIYQSRLAQMGEMISMIAHQWRQPLTAISSTTNNLTFKLMMDDVDREFFQQEIDLISNYSQHLSKTIDDFRGFFKNNKEKEITTLEEIVNSTLDIVKISLENKNIKIVTTFNCNESVETYSSEIKQVILNLIKNAEDIVLEKNITNPTITIETECQEGNKIVTIKDNGGGVAKEIEDKIFEPYFSTKLEKDGTGLGLYMSKIIIENHCGGELTVCNDKDGAIFKIKIGE